MLVRRALFAVSLLASLLGSMAAYGQAPPAVPALPDTERRTSYSITATKCVCSVGFAIYGDSTDVDEWIQVWVNGVRALSTDSTFGWSLSSATGPLLTIPRPITDAVLTFNSNQTAVVQIVGARRPRQLTQFIENRGVPARDLNQRLTDITAIERELWDKTNDLTGRTLLTQPGNIMKPLPLPSSCINSALSFGADGLTPACLPFILPLPSISTSNVLGNFSGLPAPAAAVPVPSCASDGFHSLTNQGGVGFNCTLSLAGTVTSVAAGCGTSTFGAAITTTGVIASVENYNPQAGTSYTVVNGDCGFLTKFTSNSAIAVTLPQANNPAGVNFVQGWYNDMCARGSGTATVMPQTSTINGVATLAIASGQCARIISDGTNYQVVTLSSSGGGGTVTGTGTANQVSFWSGTSAITGDTGFTYAGSNGAVVIGGGLANQLSEIGAATTVAPSISAIGSDTNVGLVLNTKGTGNLTFSVGVGNGNVTFTPSFVSVNNSMSFETGGGSQGFLCTGTANGNPCLFLGNNGTNSFTIGPITNDSAALAWGGRPGAGGGGTMNSVVQWFDNAPVLLGPSNTVTGWLNWNGQASLDADFSATSNTTLANVTGTNDNLSLNLAAARTYNFTIELFLVTGASAGGIKIGLGGTATITNLIADGVCVDSTTEIAVTRVSTLTQMVANTNAGTTPKCKLSGTFTVNAAGTLTVQFAQNASNGTASTVKRGSYMQAMDAKQ